MSRRKFLARSAVAGASAFCGRRAPAENPPNRIVAESRLIGELFRGNSFRITGQDAATSLVLPGGDSLWIFGDTVEGEFKSIRNLDLKDKLSNTAAIVPPQNASNGLPKFQFLATADGLRPRQLVPFREDEDPARNRIWPMHGFCRGQTVYLYYHRISLKPGVDVFDDFTLDGMGVARADVDSLQFERVAAPDGTQEFWKGDQPGFGVYAQESEGYVYLWGSLMTGMFLARTRPEDAEKLDGYEYLVEAPTVGNPSTAPRWSRQFTPTGSLFDGVPNEMSASYNKHLGCYLAIHNRLRENEIVVRTAPRLTGPWSEGEVAFRPTRRTAADLFYAAKEHPELAREGGRIIYLTFVDSASYVPQLVEVTLASR
jgi:hypothetical protein